MGSSLPLRLGAQVEEKAKVVLCFLVDVLGAACHTLPTVGDGSP